MQNLEILIKNTEIEDLIEFLVNYIEDHYYIKKDCIASDYLMENFDLGYREALPYQRRLRFKINKLIQIGLNSNTIIKFNKHTYQVIDGKNHIKILKEYQISGEDIG